MHYNCKRELVCRFVKDIQIRDKLLKFGFIATLDTFIVIVLYFILTTPSSSVY